LAAAEGRKPQTCSCSGVWQHQPLLLLHMAMAVCLLQLLLLLLGVVAADRMKRPVAAKGAHSSLRQERVAASLPHSSAPRDPLAHQLLLQLQLLVSSSWAVSAAPQGLRWLTLQLLMLLAHHITGRAHSSSTQSLLLLLLLQVRVGMGMLAVQVVTGPYLVRKGVRHLCARVHRALSHRQQQQQLIAAEVGRPSMSCLAASGPHQMLTQMMTWQLVVTQGASIPAAGTASANPVASRLTSSSSKV
jgi:hypothetical protein